MDTAGGVDMGKRGCFVLVGVHCSVVPAEGKTWRCGTVMG